MIFFSQLALLFIQVCFHNFTLKFTPVPSFIHIITFTMCIFVLRGEYGVVIAEKPQQSINISFPSLCIRLVL